MICQRPITDTITKNKFSLFHKQPKKAYTKTNYQAASLKANCSPFLRIYISCRTRDGDLTQFQHENQVTLSSKKYRSDEAIR